MAGSDASFRSSSYPFSGSSVTHDWNHTRKHNKLNQQLAALETCRRARPLLLSIQLRIALQSSKAVSDRKASAFAAVVHHIRACGQLDKRQHWNSMLQFWLLALEWKQSLTAKESIQLAAAFSTGSFASIVEDLDWSSFLQSGLPWLCYDSPEPLRALLQHEVKLLPLLLNGIQPCLSAVVHQFTSCRTRSANGNPVAKPRSENLEAVCTMMLQACADHPDCISAGLRSIMLHQLVLVCTTVLQFAATENRGGRPEEIGCNAQSATVSFSESLSKPVLTAAFAALSSLLTTLEPASLPSEDQAASSTSASARLQNALLRLQKLWTSEVGPIMTGSQAQQPPCFQSCCHIMARISLLGLTESTSQDAAASSSSDKGNFEAAAEQQPAAATSVQGSSQPVHIRDTTCRIPHRHQTGRMMPHAWRSMVQLANESQADKRHVRGPHYQPPIGKAGAFSAVAADSAGAATTCPPPCHACISEELSAQALSCQVAFCNTWSGQTAHLQQALTAAGKRPDLGPGAEFRSGWSWSMGLSGASKDAVAEAVAMHIGHPLAVAARFWEMLKALAMLTFQPDPNTAVPVRIMRDDSYGLDNPACSMQEEWPVLIALVADTCICIAEAPHQALLLDRTLGMSDGRDQSAWLRRCLINDQSVMQQAERGLLALSNSWAYGEDESFVFAETSRRVASMVQSLMPYTVLTPHATLQQLVASGASSAGQGKLVAEVLAAMPALASLQSWNATGSSAPIEAESSAQLTTVLLSLLLDKLLSLEDSVAQADAFLSFSTTLCTPSATCASPALNHSALLNNLVLPALGRACLTVQAAQAAVNAESTTANSSDSDIGLTALSTALQIAGRCIEQIAEASPHLQLEVLGAAVSAVTSQTEERMKAVAALILPLCQLADGIPPHTSQGSVFAQAFEGAWDVLEKALQCMTERLRCKEQQDSWLVQHVKEVGRLSGQFGRPVRTVLQPCYLAFIQQPASLQNRADLYVRGLKDAPDYKEFVKRVLYFAAVNDASADHLARALAAGPTDAVSKFAETQSWLAQYDSMLLRCAKGLLTILTAPAEVVGPALIAERAWVDVVHACAQILTTSSRLRCDRLVSKVLGPLLARVHPYMRTMKTATPLDQQALLTWTLSQVVYLVSAGAVPLSGPEESSGPSPLRRAMLASAMRIFAAHCRRLVTPVANSSQTSSDMHGRSTYMPPGRRKSPRQEPGSGQLSESGGKPVDVRVTCFCLHTWCQLLQGVQDAYDCAPAVPVLLHLLQGILQSVNEIAQGADAPGDTLAQHFTAGRIREWMHRQLRVLNAKLLQQLQPVLRAQM